MVHSKPGDSKEVDTGDTLFLEIEAMGHPCSKNIKNWGYPISVSEEIVVHSEPGDSKEVDTGDTLFLEIEATGHPYPRYQWFFCPDGGEYEPLEGRNERVLRIENVT